MWHFCGVIDIKNLKKVQERGLRIVITTTVAHVVIFWLGLSLILLYVQPLRQALIEVCKIVHNESPMYLSSILQ